MSFETALAEERRRAGKGGDDHQSRLDPHHPALRPAQRRGQLGRGGAHPDLTLAAVRPVVLSFFASMPIHKGRLRKSGDSFRLHSFLIQPTTSLRCLNLRMAMAPGVSDWN